MKKSDLKNMMIVESRDGYRYVVVDDRLYYRGGYMQLGAFTDELKYIDRTYESNDIVKVYSPIKYLPTPDDLNRVDQLCTLEWERKDDPDLPFNGKAVYTGQGRTRGDGYTVGKVYNFAEGKTTDDDGERRPIGNSPSARYISERGLKAFGFLKLIE